MVGTGAPGSNSRGRGGKFRKFTRGGGKHYSRNLKPLDENGNEISMWSEDAQKQFQNSSDEPSDSEDESSDDGGGPSGGKSREERKKEKKARKEAAIAKKRGQGVEVGDMPSSGEDSEEDSDDDMPVNPNHTKAARNMAMSTPDKEVEEAAEGVKKLAVAANRKERESSEAAAAKARYQQLHEAGKTDEAKADLARLKVIREQRAAEAARRAAEKEEREAQEAARKVELDTKEAKKRAAAMGPVAKKGGKKVTK